MKPYHRMTALLLALLLVLAFPLGVMAKDGADDDDDDSPSSSSSGSGSDDDDDDDDSDDDLFDDNGRSDDDDLFDDDSLSDDDLFDDSRSIPAFLAGNADYLALAAEKNRLAASIDALKDRLDSAKDADDEALENRLELELRVLKNQKDAVEARMLQFSGATLFQPFADDKRTADGELTALKLRRDAVELELLRLRAAFNALPAATTPEALALRQQILEQEQLKDTLQLQIREKRQALSEYLRKLYTDDEWRAAQALQNSLSQSGAVVALPLNRVLLAGQEVKFDAPPVITGGRTLIPVRSIAASLGATVLWDESEQKITIQQGSTVIEFEIGDDSMKVNGRSVSLDVPPQIVGGRTVIPLRALVESLGLKAEWDDSL